MGSGNETSATRPMLGPNLPSFLAYIERSNYFSPHVLRLKMHKVL